MSMIQIVFLHIHYSKKIDATVQILVFHQTYLYLIIFHQQYVSKTAYLSIIQLSLLLYYFIHCTYILPCNILQSLTVNNACTGNIFFWIKMSAFQTFPILYLLLLTNWKHVFFNILVLQNSMEEGRAGDHTKTSLLQQLLSDQSK